MTFILIITLKHFILFIIYFIIYFKEHHFHNNNLFNTDDLMDVGHGPD